MAVDLGFGEAHMSEKEMGKLAVQIMRMYGANRKALSPARIDLTGLQGGAQEQADGSLKVKGFVLIRK